MWWVPLVGAAVDYFSTDQTNKANASEGSKDRAFQSDQAKRSMEFSSAEALANRNFQERMSNTQFSRASADLEKAGLNRILSMAQPAPTTSGSMGQGSAGSGSRPTMIKPNIAETGMNIASAQQSIQTQKAQTKLIEAQARNVDAQTAGTLSTNKAKEMSGHLPDMINDILGPDASGAKWYERARQGLTDKLEEIFEGKTPGDYIKGKIDKQNTDTEKGRKEFQKMINEIKGKFTAPPRPPRPSIKNSTWGHPKE